MTGPYGPEHEPEPAAAAPQAAAGTPDGQSADVQSAAGPGFDEQPSPESDTTGHAVVDQALAGLARAADLPPGEQVDAYEAAHRALQQTLATIDQN